MFYPNFICQTAYCEKDFEDSLTEPPETLDNSAKSGKIDLEDIPIGRSLGAKAKNYDIMDLQTGESFKFAEGLTAEFGGDVDKWQHAKGIGLIDYYGENVKAEVHWFPEESVGKVKFKIKEWLYDES